MIAGREKISTHQLMLLFIMCTFSPAIRIFPSLTARTAKQAAWLSPVAAVIGLVVLVFIIQSFFKKGDDQNLTDVYINILGKIPGYLVMGIYLISFILLLALYTRYYAERIVSSILPDSSIQFFILVMLIFVFYVVRGGLVSLARFTELIFAVFIIIFVLSIILSFTNVKLLYLTPISYLDIIPVGKTIPVILSIWSYLLFMFFFADKVNDKENIKSLGLKATLFVAVVGVLIIVTTVGTLSSSLTERVQLPYFLMIKDISILKTLERMESVTLSAWVAADCVIISTLAYIILSIIKTLFHLSGTKTMASPIILITYTLTLGIARNRFELEEVTSKIFVLLNVILGFIIPFLVFIIGKIRLSTRQ